MIIIIILLLAWALAVKLYRDILIKESVPYCEEIAQKNDLGADLKPCEPRMILFGDSDDKIDNWKPSWHEKERELTTSQKIEEIIERRYNGYRGVKMKDLMILHDLARARTTEEGFLALLEKCETNNPKPIFKMPIL